MRGQTYAILTIVFIIIVAIFAVTNVESVTVNYLFYKGESPLILIILFSVLMGGIITAAAGSIKMFRLKRQNKKLYNDLQVLRDVLKKHQLLDEINNEDIDSID